MTAYTYEYASGRTILRNGKELIAIHRCLTPTGKNPAEAGPAEVDQITRELVRMLNAIPQIKAQLELAWQRLNDDQSPEAGDHVRHALRILEAIE